MSDFLDYIVSKTWVFTLVFIAICFVPTLMIWAKPFKKLVWNRILQFGVSLSAFGLLLYLMMGPHGYAVQYIGGLSNGKDLCLIEEHYSGDGDGGSYVNYRLFVLDLKTGKRILRLPLESPEILCVKENSVIFYLWNSAAEYDLKTGEMINEWTEEKGFEQFPELKSGISDINRSSEAYSHNNQAWLTLTAKNGHHYIYNLLTDELEEQEYPTGQTNESFKLDEYEIRFTDPADNKYWYYSFEKKTGELEELIFHDKNYAETNLGGEYLRPKMVGLYPDLALFIFTHYTTTDYNELIYTAVGFDHHLKWQVTQEDLQTADYYTDKPLPGITIPLANQQIIATFGGQAICLNAADGTVIWKSVQ